MPGEAAPLAQSNPSIAPKKKSASVGKVAVAKVTLLDGSELDVSIDVNALHYFDLRFSLDRWIDWIEWWNKNIVCLNCSAKRKGVICWVPFASDWTLPKRIILVCCTTPCWIHASGWIWRNRLPSKWRMTHGCSALLWSSIHRSQPNCKKTLRVTICVCR